MDPATDPHDAEIAKIRLRMTEMACQAWRAAETQSERLLQEWFAAAGPHRGPAYTAYRAALDREEAAARALATSADRRRAPETPQVKIST